MSQNEQMCDKFPEKPAVAAFRWEWGEEGFCSVEYRQLLEQSAQQIKRHISFTGLAGAQAAPVTRSERTQLIAAKLSAEAEADEALKRSSRLYDQVNELKGDLSTERKLRTEADAQIADRKADIEALVVKVSKLERQNGDVVQQLEKARQQLKEPDAAEEEIEGLRRQLEASEERNESLKSEIEDLKNSG